MLCGQWNAYYSRTTVASGAGGSYSSTVPFSCSSLFITVYVLNKLSAISSFSDFCRLIGFLEVKSGAAFGVLWFIFFLEGVVLYIPGKAFFAGAASVGNASVSNSSTSRLPWFSLLGAYFTAGLLSGSWFSLDLWDAVGVLAWCDLWCCGGLEGSSKRSHRLAGSFVELEAEPDCLAAFALTGTETHSVVFFGCVEPLLLLVSAGKLSCAAKGALADAGAFCNKVARYWWVVWKEAPQI